MFDKKSIVIYKSKSGFTKQYAKWIQEELGCDVVDYSYIKKLKLENYDAVIYGSRIHAGKLEGVKKIIELLKNNDESKLIIFATGGTPNAASDLIDNMWRKSLTEVELSSIPHFYMQSGLNYELMSPGDKLLMKGFNTFLGRKKAKTSEEEGCEDAIKESYDNSSKEYIEPLVSYVKDLFNKMIKE